MNTQGHPEAATTRRQLGELGVMSAQVERAERQILEHAQRLHGEVLSKLDEMRPEALTSDGGASDYQALVAERGRLERVIAQARQVLGEG
jgi:hypothetical protein